MVGLLQVLEQRVGALEEAAELALARGEEPAPLLLGLGAGMRGVGAGGEHGRRPGDDDHAGLGVVAQLDEGRGQLGQHGVAQRVAAVGPVERHGGDHSGPGQRDVVGHLDQAPAACSNGGLDSLLVLEHPLPRRPHTGGGARIPLRPARRSRASAGASISSRKRSKRAGQTPPHLAIALDDSGRCPRPRTASSVSSGGGLEHRVAPSGRSARLALEAQRRGDAGSGAARAPRRGESPAPRWSSRAGRASGGHRASAARPSARWARRSPTGRMPYSSSRSGLK